MMAITHGGVTSYEKGYFMKKNSIMLFTVLFIATSLSACMGEGKGYDAPQFESGSYPDKNWGEAVGSYAGAVVPDKEVAVEVAKDIFNGIEKSDDAQKYIPQAVFYDEQDEIWIISFWGETNESTLGGDCSIAIQKKDGKVLRIWFGE